MTDIRWQVPQYHFGASASRDAATEDATGNSFSFPLSGPTWHYCNHTTVRGLYQLELSKYPIYPSIPSVLVSHACPKAQGNPSPKRPCGVYFDWPAPSPHVFLSALRKISTIVWKKNSGALTPRGASLRYATLTLGRFPFVSASKNKAWRGKHDESRRTSELPNDQAVCDFLMSTNLIPLSGPSLQLALILLIIHDSNRDRRHVSLSHSTRRAVPPRPYQRAVQY